MPKIKYVYKVVREENGQFFSFLLTPPSRYALSYKMNEKTIPKIGYIFCFTNVTDAINFCDYALYKKGIVLYGRAKVDETFLHTVSRINDKAISSFWKDPVLLGTNYTPFGTVFCHSFTPLRIILRRYKKY